MRIVFIGTGDIGLPSLEFLIQDPDHELLAVIAQPDKPAGRKQELLPPATKIAAAKENIRVLQPPKIRAPEAVAEIRDLAPDVIVVMAYGQILPAALLQIPKIACLNLHASLLPRHRGAAPIQAAIESGDKESGITVMYMDEGLDTGDILLTRPVEILPAMTGGDLHDAVANLAPDALREALELLSKGNAPRTPQDSTQATYAPKLTREHGHVDWSLGREEIDRKIRALFPWPGCYGLLPVPDGEPLKLKLHRAAPAGNALPPRPPGTAIVDQGRLFVACRDGFLEITELQLEGKRRMTAAEFLRGRAFPEGIVLQ